MNKYQPVSFRDVDDMLACLPDHERCLVEALRKIIMNCIPGCREKLSYNVPYYSRRKRICFIWPSSVPWGGANTQGVRVGFCNGHLLTDELNYLDKGNRKRVYWKDFTSIQDINIDVLKLYIFEAVVVDEELARKKG